jgi:hypothetical protein
MICNKLPPLINKLTAVIRIFTNFAIAVFISHIPKGQASATRA